MGFDYPWVLLLLVVILPLLWAFRRSELFTRSVVYQFRSTPPTLMYFRLRYLCAGLFVVSLILAGAGPYREPQQTADYLFLVDTSRSMQARNSCAEPTFLDRAKHVMQDIMEGIPEARFGIVAFDRLTFPITQMTFSRSYLRSVMNNGLFVGMTYRATNTDMLNALRVIAIKKQTLPELYRNVNHVILFSDGNLEDEDWRQHLEQPLRDLTAAGITIQVVGIGNAIETPVPVTNQDDVCQDTLSVMDDKIVRIPLRSDILQVVATGSQGQYFNESQTGDLINYLREATLVDVPEGMQFGTEQHIAISWMLLIVAVIALFGLFLL